MNAIWKYELMVDSKIKLEIPKGGVVLSVQSQNNKPCIWVLVDTEAKKEARWFETFGTGHPIPEGVSRDYKGTYQINEGTLVFHVFEHIR